ncbi:MAG: metal ABC transporter permease [Chlamydiia bacterium]|nr:metal ABC transporter permease [Chlamydiia bacterium]
MLANPYFNTTFFSFFTTLFQRIWLLLSGQLPPNALASDEIQLIVLITLATTSAFVGTFLIYRHMAMLANAISHTLLLGIVLAYIALNLSQEAVHAPLPLNLLFAVAIFMGCLTALLTEWMTSKTKLQADASTGLVFSTLFALGLILVTLYTRNLHLGTEAVMGNVDALQLTDCQQVVIVLLSNALLFALFFKEFTITTFDQSLSKHLGISLNVFNYLLMAQTSLTVVAGFRAVGVIMILSLLTGPPLIARFLFHRLRTVIAGACVIGSISALFSVALSRHLLTTHGLALSTGGLTITLIGLIFTVTAVFRSLRS